MVKYSRLPGALLVFKIVIDFLNIKNTSIELTRWINSCKRCHKTAFFLKKKDIKTIITEANGLERKVMWFEKKTFVEIMWDLKIKELIISKISSNLVGIGKKASSYINLSSNGSHGLSNEKE